MPYWLLLSHSFNIKMEHGTWWKWRLKTWKHGTLSLQFTVYHQLICDVLGLRYILISTTDISDKIKYRRSITIDNLSSRLNHINLLIYLSGIILGLSDLHIVTFIAVVTWKMLIYMYFEATVIESMVLTNFITMLRLFYLATFN